MNFDTIHFNFHRDASLPVSYEDCGQRRENGRRDGNYHSLNVRSVKRGATKRLRLEFGDLAQSITKFDGLGSHQNRNVYPLGIGLLGVWHPRIVVVGAGQVKKGMVAAGGRAPFWRSLREDGLRSSACLLVRGQRPDPAPTLDAATLSVVVVVLFSLAGPRVVGNFTGFGEEG